MHVYRSLQKKGQPLCLTNSVTHYPVVHRGYPAELIDDALKTGDMGGKDRLPKGTQRRIDWWKASSKRFQASGKRASVRRVGCCILRVAFVLFVEMLTFPNVAPRLRSGQTGTVAGLLLKNGLRCVRLALVAR